MFKSRQDLKSLGLVNVVDSNDFKNAIDFCLDDSSSDKIVATSEIRGLDKIALCIQSIMHYNENELSLCQNQLLNEILNSN